MMWLSRLHARTLVCFAFCLYNTAFCNANTRADAVSTLRGLLEKSTDEALAIAAATDVMLDRTTAPQLIAAAMHRGWFDLTDRLVSSAAAAGVDVSHSVHTAANGIRTRLQRVVEHLNDAAAAAARAAQQAQQSAESTTPNGEAPAASAAASPAVPAGIAPAFEWAQSPDALLLQVKFSHKLDTPATLGCEADREGLGLSVSGRHVSFRADCKAARKAFHLTFTALRELDGENSTWSMTSVGRATLTLRKATAAMWPRLLSSTAKARSQVHTWWQMQEKLKGEIEAWEQKRKDEAVAAKAAAVAAAANATGTADANGTDAAGDGGAGAADAAAATGATDAAAAQPDSQGSEGDADSREEL